MVRDGQMWVDRELGPGRGKRREKVEEGQAKLAERRKGSREKTQIWLVMATDPA